MMNTSRTTGRRLGLAIFGFLSVGDIATLAITDGETPPYAVAAVGALLGLVSLVLAIQAFRDPSKPLRLLIGLRVLSAITVLPAFFVSDVPVGAQAAAAGVVVLTAAGVLLVAGGHRVTVAS
ncbi:hypothetical protein [Aeromicrobium sp.]|uniref:hypothetical protein n=1 Tax=Aeromicrobium sp. TaxID=1871063 RepID=UPI0030C5E619